MGGTSDKVAVGTGRGQPLCPPPPRPWAPWLDTMHSVPCHGGDRHNLPPHFTSGLFSPGEQGVFQDCTCSPNT